MNPRLNERIDAMKAARRAARQRAIKQIREIMRKNGIKKEEI